MIDDLLSLKKITPGEYDTYILFQVNELGRNSLERMMFDSFMDEPVGTDRNGEGFAFYDGRRSVFRDIRRTIMKVQYLLEEISNNDKRSDENKGRRKRKQ